MESNWQYYINGLRNGDKQATLDFCEQYGAALARLAKRHLVTGLQRRLDPEDVVQSVYRTFFRRVSDGQFQLSGKTDLWRLLCVITLTKAKEQARYQMRQKRSINKETSIDGGTEKRPKIIKAKVPPPDASMEFTEQFEKIICSFDEEQRRIIELKLQELNNEQVADQMGCSERTIRRILKGVEQNLEERLDSQGK